LSKDIDSGVLLPAAFTPYQSFCLSCCSRYFWRNCW